MLEYKGKINENSELIYYALWRNLVIWHLNNFLYIGKNYIKILLFPSIFRVNLSLAPDNGWWPVWNVQWGPYFYLIYLSHHDHKNEKLWILSYQKPFMSQIPVTLSFFFRNRKRKFDHWRVWITSLSYAMTSGRGNCIACRRFAVQILMG